MKFQEGLLNFSESYKKGVKYFANYFPVLLFGGCPFSSYVQFNRCLHFENVSRIVSELSPKT